MLKRCRTCEKEKPIDEFYKNWQARDGRSSQCRRCWSKYYQRNRERKLAYLRQYREDVKTGARVPRPRWKPRTKEVA